MKIGYQGIEGSYSEVALLKHFGKDIETVGMPTFQDVFEALEKNSVDHIFVPVENTIAGSVAENFDLLLKKDVFVIAEIFLKIRHNLLSHKEGKIENVKKVYSHLVALSQCKDFLRKQKMEAMPFYDSAGAAKMVSESKDKDMAAIASELCSSLYGLKILKKDIQTNKDNTTRFFVITKKKNVPKDLGQEKTSIVFKVKHRSGSLVDCLQRLSKNNINLTKLESRPIPENPWEYVFYADFEGALDDDNVKLTLNEMEAASIFVKVLGSYPKGKTHS